MHKISHSRSPCRRKRYINTIKIDSKVYNKRKKKKKTNNSLRLDVSNQNPEAFPVSFLQNFQIKNSMSVLICQV
jgi:hypothetical protein